MAAVAKSRFEIFPRSSDLFNFINISKILRPACAIKGKQKQRQLWQGTGKREREREGKLYVLYEAEQRWAKFCLRNVGQVKSVKMNAYMRRRRGHFEGSPLMALGQLTAFRQASWQQIGLLFVFVKRLNLLCFGSGEQRKHYERLPALPCSAGHRRHRHPGALIACQATCRKTQTGLKCFE